MPKKKKTFFLTPLRKNGVKQNERVSPIKEVKISSDENRWY